MTTTTTTTTTTTATATTTTTRELGENGVYHMRVAEARRKCQRALTDLYFRGMPPFTDGEYVPQWTADYDRVADWLTDNHGKGLLMVGGVGCGKTLFARHIIPSLVLQEYRKLVRYTTAAELSVAEEDDYRATFNAQLLVIDDIGTEDMRNYYGKVQIPFARIMDRVEQRGGLVIATSNETIGDLRQKYGERTWDRINRHMKVVIFTGKSLRANPKTLAELPEKAQARFRRARQEWEQRQQQALANPEQERRQREWEQAERQWRTERAKECKMSVEEWEQTRAKDFGYLMDLWKRDYRQRRSGAFFAWMMGHQLWTDDMEYNPHWMKEVVRDMRNTIERNKKGHDNIALINQK